ncbi:MAG: prepilin-type N-terminal cleavage/methylation domain-containing protein [Gemmatimonas sp.]|nr:prepilin-type N-terminal cleavage/methylation domain-containing protein [Gemmatimonas sp.]
MRSRLPCISPLGCPALPRALRADQKGFTLVELMVAMAVAAVIVTALFQFITAEGRFFELQSAHQEVQQNTRVVVELIGSELRSLPPGESLVRAAADSLTIRTAKVWGVVCALGGATTLDVVMPAVPGLNFTQNSGSGLVVNLGTEELPVWSDPVLVTAIGEPLDECAGERLSAQAERRTFSVGSMPRKDTLSIGVGNTLYLYEQVTYRAHRSEGVPGMWIQRRIGDLPASTNQPMAGPVDESAGLRFQYFAGATPLATPILESSARSAVTHILLAVEAVSQTTFGAEEVARSDTVVAILRNRR